MLRVWSVFCDYCFPTAAPTNGLYRRPAGGVLVASGRLHLTWAFPMSCQRQMNGADPYSALHHQTAQPAPAVPPPAQATTRVAAGGVARGFPILDKHTKPLVGSDTAKAVSGRLHPWFVFFPPSERTSNETVDRHVIESAVSRRLHTFFGVKVLLVAMYDLFGICGRMILGSNDIPFSLFASITQM